MAKNWTAAEAAKVAFEGTDLKAIGDLTRRFPFFTMLCTRLNEAGVEALSYLPEWITARKLEKAYKMAHGLIEKDVENALAAEIIKACDHPLTGAHVTADENGIQIQTI